MKQKNRLFSELVQIKDEVNKQIPLASNRYDEFETAELNADFDEVARKYQEHEEQYTRVRTEYFIIRRLKESFEEFFSQKNISYEKEDKSALYTLYKDELIRFIAQKKSRLLAKIERTQRYLGCFTDLEELKKYLDEHMDEIIANLCYGNGFSLTQEDFAIRLEKDMQLAEHREIEELQYSKIDLDFLLRDNEEELKKAKKTISFLQGIYCERVNANVGYCDEYTSIALVKIFQRRLVTEHVIVEKIGIQYLEDDGSVTDGHTFLAINRDPESQLDDILSWGKNAILMDPWNKLVCFAEDFNSLPLHYFSYPRSIIFEGEIHCAKWTALKFTHDDCHMLENLKQLDNYYTMTGHNNVFDREDALIEEYELISLDAPEFKKSKNFLDSLLKSLVPNNFNQDVKIYLTMHGKEFVTPLSGFSKATIAIHKDFLCDINQGGKYTIEELEFGLAVALYQIKFNPFNNNSTQNQYQIDELALEKCRNGDAAVSYLQKSILFDKENQVAKNELFLKLESFTNSFTNKTDLTLRIKNILAKLAQLNIKSKTMLPLHTEIEPFKEIKSATRSGFFNTDIYKSLDSNVLKINYLISRLAELKIELFPYEVSQQPSVRLREFCRLLRQLNVDLNMPEQAFAVDKLINAAFDLEIPGFECIYRAVCNADSQTSKVTKDLPPLGLMKDYQLAINCFVNAKNFSEAMSVAQVILKYQANLKNHFMYQNSKELLDIKKLRDSNSRFFCSSIGTEIAWETFPFIPIHIIPRVGKYLDFLKKIKSNSYLFFCTIPYELYYINSAKKHIKLDLNTIPGLAEIVEKDGRNIEKEVQHVISSYLLQLRRNLPWDTHLDWALCDQSSTIADALWHVGVVRDTRLWSNFSNERLRQKITVQKIYNDKMSSKYNPNYSYPIVRLAGDLERYGDAYYYSETNKQLIQYFSDTHQIKTDMFNDVNKFEDAFCQFYDANLFALIYPDRFTSSNNPTVHFLLNKFAEIALYGGEQDKNMVKSFFLRREDKRDLRNLQGFDYHGNGVLDEDSPYLEFILHQRYQNKSFTLFSLEETLKLFHTIKFMREYLEAEYYISLFKFPQKSDFDLDCLQKIIVLLKEFRLDFSILYGCSYSIEKIIKYHLTYHTSYELFSRNTAKLTEFLLEYLTNPCDSSARNSIFSSIKENTTFPDLTADELVTIYRAHDIYLKFKSYDQQYHFGNIILGKIKTLSIDEQIKIIEKLLFISEKLSDMPLNDIQFRNELVALWVKNILAKFGKDNNANNYISGMKILIHRVHANTHSRDGEYILSQLANAILAQNKLSEHIGMLLEPEKYIVSDQEIETILRRRKSNDTTKESIFAVVRLLGKDKSDRMYLLEFLSSPLSGISLKYFADYLIGRGKSADLISQILPENVLVSKESLECVLQLIYNMFWNCSLQSRAVVVDYLLIPADDVTNEEVNKKSYEEAFLYVANKLFPNAKIDENENFAVSFLKAYLDVTDKFMRTYLLAAMLVTSNATHNAKTRVGQKLVTLCEHLGPAYVKLAQAIHSYPDTPEDIREDLAGVKGRANPPTRWQLWRLINEVLIDDKDQIAYLGAVLGSASFNIAVEVHLKNNTDAVLLLLRENARKDADVGFNQLHKTVEICQHQKMNSIREISMSLIDEAKDLSVLEMDRKAGDLQSEIAANIYHSLLEVKINNVNYNIVCFSSKTISSGEGYRFIERVYGTEYNDLPVLNSHDYALKKAIAKAVVSIELINILSGSYFDCDRHGNQLRVYVNHHTHTIQLGLYDFGEMAIKEPSAQELKQLNKFIAMIPGLFLHQKPMAVTFSNYISEVKKEGQPTEYLMKIRKALLAIQDFQKYLTNDEIVEILKFIGSKNAVHPAIKSTYTTTLSQVGAMNFMFKVGQGFRDYMSSARKSCSTFFSSKTFLEIGKREHIDDVDDNSLELPELKKSKKNIDPIIIDVNKVQVSSILSWNPNHAVIQFKP